MVMSELIKYISSETGFKQQDIKEVFDSMVSGIIHGMKKDNIMKLPGLGTFYLHKKKARNVRNPKTGEIIFIDERVLPKFKASPKLKQQISED